MTDPDDFDEVLRDVGRFRERKPSEEKIDDMPFGDLEQMEDDYQFSPEDELIIGDDYATYILYADGTGVSDFTVHAEESGIEVKTDEFVVRKDLGIRVDPQHSTATYNNGVLSVRLRLVGDRDDAVA